MRSATSAPTRPACTSRPSPSRISARCNGWHERLPEAGLTAEIDGIGNVLGTSAKSGPKLLAGSHLESQNFAGWLDGPLGVVYALEAARVINPDPDVNGAVEVASWCDEEGHFGSFLGSRSYVGGVTEADIDAARDRTSGKPMRDALRDAGLAGRARATAERGRHIGYLEAHIEQGQTLEGGGLAIGVVTSIVGIWQYRIVLTGEQNHAGTTRMSDREEMPAWRWRDFASPSTTVSRRCADRARSGPPAASRSIPARPASFRALLKCCSRSATMIPA